jgi:tetratricopeptide (TPR) repeat protein
MEQQLSLPVPTAREAPSRVMSEAGSGRHVLVYLLVAAGAVVFLVFLPALSARAVFLDDTFYLTENPLVTNPGWHSVRRFFAEVLHPSSVPGYYQPLTMASLMVDYALASPGDALRPFHQTSLLLHVGNTMLVAVLLYLLFGQPWVAAAVGLLFGLHPVAVDSVCWLSERKTVLATFFALWSLILYVRFVRTGRRRNFFASLLLYVLALLSKPITVPVPLAMLLLDYWPLRRFSRQAVMEKLPLLALSAAFSVVTFVSQSRGAMILVPGRHDVLHVLWIVCHNIIFYLYKIGWPVHLSPHYGFPRSLDLSQPMILAGVLGTGVLLPALLVSLRWTRALLTGWLMFFVILLPAMGIISVTPVLAANRYAYFPSLGLWLALAGGLAWLCRLENGRRSMGRVVATGVVLLATAGESLASGTYLHRWHDTKSLCEYALTITPGEAILHNELGNALGLQGKFDEAIDQYRQALKSSPKLALAHFNLASALSASAGKIDEAIEHYRAALELEPRNCDTHLSFGSLLCTKGHLDEALAHFAMAVQLNPGYALGHYNLGKALAAADHPQDGIQQLRAAARLGPTNLSTMIALAWLLATHPNTAVRDPNEAIALAERARTMTGGRDARTLDTLAAAYAVDGQYAKAVETARQAHAIAVRLRDHELASQIEERLELYQLECPYYENPRVPLDRLIAQTRKKQTGDSKPKAVSDQNPKSEIHDSQSETTGRKVQDEADAVSAR